LPSGEVEISPNVNGILDMQLGCGSSPAVPTGFSYLVYMHSSPPKKIET
jgi:hypothetical protein